MYNVVQRHCTGMVAFALLYSGRYEDTQVLHGRKDARQGAIVLNMENYQQVSPCTR